MLKQSAENNGDLLMSNAYMNTNKFHSLGQSAATNEKYGGKSLKVKMEYNTEK